MLVIRYVAGASACIPSIGVAVLINSITSAITITAVIAGLAVLVCFGRCRDRTRKVVVACSDFWHVDITTVIDRPVVMHGFGVARVTQIIS
jgi:hypothetical protein